MAFVNKASASDKYSSSDDESDEMYEDQYASQIGKSVKCTQFINNTKVATKGQGQAKQGQGQAKQGQVQAKQGQGQTKQYPQVHSQVQVQAQVQAKQQDQNTAREVVDDWEDLM